MATDFINATVDWNAVQGQTKDEHFGINVYRAVADTANSKYHNNMSYMSPGMIRLHNMDFMKDSSAEHGLIDNKNKTWDAKKVVNAIKASIDAFGTDQPQRMFNIPSWPSWMDANNDGYLDADQFDNYAQFCADLVKIVNQDNKLGVQYWEITNEKDNEYFAQFYTKNGWGRLIDPNQPDRMDEFITIYNKVAQAMKAVDPSIKVGGPSIARSDLTPFYQKFIEGTVENLDFFTYHYYASGSTSTPDAKVFNASNSIGDYTKKIVETLKKASPNREIPAILGEYNISWTWDIQDPRMTNNKGAVFDALSMIEAIENGAAASLSWNEKDDIYGKTNYYDVLRPGGELLHLFNTYLVGNRISTTSNDSTITTFAVDRPGSHKAYVLINSSDSPQAVTVRFNNWNSTQSSVSKHIISASGYDQENTAWTEINNGTVLLPPGSIILFEDKENSGSSNVALPTTPELGSNVPVIVPDTPTSSTNVGLPSTSDVSSNTPVIVPDTPIANEGSSTSSNIDLPSTSDLGSNSSVVVSNTPSDEEGGSNSTNIESPNTSEVSSNTPVAVPEVPNSSDSPSGSSSDTPTTSQQSTTPPPASYYNEPERFDNIEFSNNNGSSTSDSSQLQNSSNNSQVVSNTSVTSSDTSGNQTTAQSTTGNSDSITAVSSSGSDTLSNTSGNQTTAQSTTGNGDTMTAVSSSGLDTLSNTSGNQTTTQSTTGSGDTMTAVSSSGSDTLSNTSGNQTTAQSTTGSGDTMTAVSSSGSDILSNTSGNQTTAQSTTGNGDTVTAVSSSGSDTLSNTSGNQTTTQSTTGNGDTITVVTSSTDSQGLLLDFRKVDLNNNGQIDNKVSVNFNDISSDALYNNSLGFYKVVNADGAVLDSLTGKLIYPDETSYAQVALEQRVLGVDLNRNTGKFVAQLEGGALYAPYLIANGTTQQYLNSEASNQKSDQTLQVFFNYGSANSDKINHVKLLGNNQLGFEDTLGGGDRDFNDFVFKVKVQST
ncbi:hypothetical protein NUACC21_58910 [Scytonema sp. NUACC21]